MSQEWNLLQKSWSEECGVFGIWRHPEASRMAYLGLYALQHRGQESCGIVSLHNGQQIHHKGLGLVADNFDEETLDRLKGSVAIGHVRYATTGDNLLTNAQPLTADLPLGPIAIGHNGNIVNTKVLKNDLLKEGAIFQGTNDTEVLLHLIARNKSNSIEDKLVSALSMLEGAYSLLVLTQDKMIAIRDPMGFRPMSIGELSLPGGQKSYVVASETCAFDLIGAKWVRDVECGEIVIIDNSGLKTRHLPKTQRLAQCIFEHVYFARPDSVVFGRGVYEVRKNLGKILAKENPAPADIVVPVPDSGVPAALGFSEESKIPFDMGIIRNHYVGRTFIEPRQHIRSFGVKIKLNPMNSLLKGKRVAVIDDSLVRGTTSQKIINLVRQAGAKEVHLRIAAPPTTGPCYYGVDTPTKTELIAANQSLEEITKFVGADTLGYLSHEGLLKAAQARGDTFCSACFSGKYPTPLYEN